MNMVKISKLLDFLSYIGILIIIGFYIFNKPTLEVSLIMLLAVAIIRMIASVLKANFYEKGYHRLKEDNEFLQRRIDSLLKEQSK